MTHSPPSVVSCPSPTCRPSWSRCQGSLTTWWPSSLHLKCASETSSATISATETPPSHAEINGCHSLVKGHFRPVPGIQYDLRVGLIIRETLTPKGPVVWRRC